MRTHSLPESLRDGVRFRCIDCGACCTGAPGRVRISEAELKAVSEVRNQPVEEVRARFARLVNGEWLLRERENGDCVFFEDNRCGIHSVKPKQCRLYPFWFQNVRNDAAWRKTREACPGIGEGPRISPAEIAARVREDLDG